MNPILRPLSAAERSKHLATHLVVVTAAMIAAQSGAGTANTAVAVPLFLAKTGWQVRYVGHKLVTPLANSADSAFNTSTSVVGDSGSTNRLGVSQELNLNGSYVPIGPVGVPATTQPYLYGSDTQINATIGSMTGKKLSDLDQGEVHYLFAITDVNAPSDSIAPTD